MGERQAACRRERQACDHKGTRLFAVAHDSGGVRLSSDMDAKRAKRPARLQAVAEELNEPIERVRYLDYWKKLCVISKVIICNCRYIERGGECRECKIREVCR